MKAIALFVSVLIVSNIFSQDISNANSWAYQLQEINISDIASNNSFDLIVMDYSQDGTDEQKFTQSQIQQIKDSGKLAICYISIGEAEDYRYYWKSSWNNNPPEWLGAENPDWQGNYKVKYWYPEWQSIIFDYLDTIMSQGFNGIYLDIIDAYYYWTEEAPANEQQIFADTIMVDFVYKIRQHIDSISNNVFYIIPQNASMVIDDYNGSAALKNKYFSAIDAIGVEDVFFYGNLDMDNNYNPDNYRISMLSNYIDAGKKVFSIEYLSDQQKINQYIDVANNNNYIPYACVRNLDQLCNGLESKITEIKTDDFINLYVKGNKIFVNSSKNIEYYIVYNLRGEIIQEDGYNSKTFQINIPTQQKQMLIIEFGDDTFEVKKKVVIN